MRRADERRSASMMISSSIRWSLAGKRGRLDHEHVGAADVFLDLDEDLHVGEAPHHGLGQRRGRDRRAIASASVGLELPATSLMRSILAAMAASSVRKSHRPCRGRRGDNKEPRALAIRPLLLSRSFFPNWRAAWRCRSVTRARQRGGACAAPDRPRSPHGGRASPRDAAMRSLAGQRDGVDMPAVVRLGPVGRAAVASRTAPDRRRCTARGPRPRRRRRAAGACGHSRRGRTAHDRPARPARRSGCCRGRRATNRSIRSGPTS